MQRYGTPLRYPGGKQRLAPFVGEILAVNNLVGGEYAEPYAGGAGVAVELLLSNQVSRIHLNDSSLPVYAIWFAITEHPERLCRFVRTASLTLEEWKRHREVVRHPDHHHLIDIGISTFFLNRCNRSGVLGAGVIGGFAQDGRWRIDARFPRNELIKRIEAIAKRASAISITRLDAEVFMGPYAETHLPADTLVYCDPPYFKGAERLYLNVYSGADHARLARAIQRNKTLKWLVSYDSHRSILELYRRRRMFTYDLQYSATRACLGKEVFIFSDSLRIPSRSSIKAVQEALDGSIKDATKRPLWPRIRARYSARDSVQPRPIV